MSITAQSILDKAATILMDVAGVRWAPAELLGWLNDGQRAICEAKPIAYTRVATAALVAGTRQTLPSDATFLVDLVRNMGTDGLSPGPSIRKVGRRQLDTSRPEWHSDPATAVVRNFVTEDTTERTFYVYPASKGTTQVEMVYAAVPPAVALADPITLGDQYANPLLDFVLYRAYLKDAEQPANAERALLHRGAFETALGLYTKARAENAAVANG